MVPSVQLMGVLKKLQINNVDISTILSHSNIASGQVEFAPPKWGAVSVH